jgi:hypothetical protein
MRKLFILTPLQTFIVYILVALIFVVPGIIFRINILVALGVLALVWSFVAAFVVSRIRK